MRRHESFTVPKTWMLVAAEARKAGVAAILFQSTRPRGLLYRHPLAMTNEAYAPPAAVVSREQAAWLGRLAEHGEVRLRLRLENRTGVTDTKLDVQMKAFGQWDDFVAGRRGVR